MPNENCTPKKVEQLKPSNKTITTLLRSHSYVTKMKQAKPKLRRHASLADIAREYKVKFQSSPNDIRKFYTDKTNDEFRDDFTQRSHHKHKRGETLDYLSHSTTLPENSNFLFRTGSQLFNNEEPDHLCPPLIPGNHTGDCVRSSHINTRISSQSSSRQVSRQGSIINFLDRSERVPMEATHDAEVNNSDLFLDAFDCYSSTEAESFEENGDDTLLFIGRRFRSARSSTSSSSIGYESSSDTESDKETSISVPNSIWSSIAGLFGFYVNIEKPMQNDDISFELISTFII